MGVILSACGGGDGGIPTPPGPNPGPILIPDDDPTKVETGASTSATVSTASRSLTLANIGTIELSEADAATGPAVTLTKTQDPQSAETFTNIQQDLDIQSGSDYELTVSVTSVPASDITVEMNVPAALTAALTDRNALAVYIEMPEDDDQPATYIPVESTYDEATKTVIASVPEWAFGDQGDGTFAAKLKIGLANAYDSTATSSPASLARALTLPDAGDKVNHAVAPALLCPSNSGIDGCLETSRVGPRVGGQSNYHYGIDLRGNGNAISAAAAGQVLRIDTDWGAVVVQSGPIIYKYLHMTGIGVAKGAAVQEGATLGVAGAKHPSKVIEPHLHFEVLYPSTKACQKAAGAPAGCSKEIRNYVDPFRLLVGKVQLKRYSPAPVAAKDDEFALVLEGQDKAGTKVTTEINNNGGTVKGRIRKVSWGASDASILDVKSAETTTGTNPEVGQDPSKRNEGTVKVLKEAGATVTAQWEGVETKATYVVNAAVEAYYVNTEYFISNAKGSVTQGDLEYEVQGLSVGPDTSMYDGDVATDGFRQRLRTGIPTTTIICRVNGKFIPKLVELTASEEGDTCFGTHPYKASLTGGYSVSSEGILSMKSMINMTSLGFCTSDNSGVKTYVEFDANWVAETTGEYNLLTGDVTSSKAGDYYNKQVVTTTYPGKTPVSENVLRTHTVVFPSATTFQGTIMGYPAASVWSLTPGPDGIPVECTAP